MTLGSLVMAHHPPRPKWLSTPLPCAFSATGLGADTRIKIRQLRLSTTGKTGINPLNSQPSKFNPQLPTSCLVDSHQPRNTMNTRTELAAKEHTERTAPSPPRSGRGIKGEVSIRFFVRLNSQPSTLNSKPSNNPSTLNSQPSNNPSTLNPQPSNNPSTFNQSSSSLPSARIGKESLETLTAKARKEPLNSQPSSE